MKNHLFRDRAPITEAGWEEIEKEAKRTLRALLAARRVVDFKGPLGWGASDVELGRADPIASPPGSAESCGRGCAASSRWSSCAFPSRSRAPNSTPSIAARAIPISTR